MDTKSVPPYSIVGGNPARVIRSRFTEEEIAQHEAALYDSRGSVKAQYESYLEAKAATPPLP